MKNSSYLKTNKFTKYLIPSEGLYPNVDVALNRSEGNFIFNKYFGDYYNLEFYLIEFRDLKKLKIKAEFFDRFSTFIETTIFECVYVPLQKYLKHTYDHRHDHLTQLNCRLDVLHLGDLGIYDSYLLSALEGAFQLRTEINSIVGLFDWLNSNDISNEGIELFIKEFFERMRGELMDGDIINPHKLMDGVQDYMRRYIENCFNS